MELTESILSKIKEKLVQDTRPPQAIYQHIKALGTTMILTNTLSEEQVISFCSSLIKLYERLKGT